MTHRRRGGDSAAQGPVHSWGRLSLRSSAGRAESTAAVAGGSCTAPAVQVGTGGLAQRRPACSCIGVLGWSDDGYAQPFGRSASSSARRSRRATYAGVASRHVGPLLVVDGPFCCTARSSRCPSRSRASTTGRSTRCSAAPTCCCGVRPTATHGRSSVCFGAEAAAYRVEVYPATTPTARRCPTRSQWQFEQVAEFFDAFGWSIATDRRSRPTTCSARSRAAETAAGGGR